MRNEVSLDDGEKGAIPFHSDLLRGHIWHSVGNSDIHGGWERSRGVFSPAYTSIQ